MKRALSIFVVLVLVISMVQMVSADGVRVVVDYNEISFTDAFPFIDENGRTQVPLRALAESMGATVEWDDATQTIELTRKASISGVTNKSIFVVGSNTNHSYKLSLDNSVFNELDVVMDTAPIIIEGRTYIPARYVADSMGFSVFWDEDTQEVRCYDAEQAERG